MVRVSQKLIVLCLALMLCSPVVAAEVIIDSDLDSNPDIYARKNNIVFVTDQIGYVFYADNNRNVVYKKTFNGGANWGSKNILFADAASTGVMIWYDRWTPGDTGTLIHLISVDDAQEELHYAKFDVTNDNVSSYANLSDSRSNTFGTQTRYYVTKATDGYIYAGVMDSGGAGSFVRKCNSDCQDYLSWSDAGELPFPDGSDDDIILMPLPAGQIMGLHWDINWRDITYSIYTRASNTWTSPVALNTDARAVSSYKSAWGASVDPLTNDIYFIYHTYTNDNDSINPACVYSSGVWDCSTNSESTKTHLNESNSDVPSMAIGIDANNSDSYSVYPDNNSGGSNSWVVFSEQSEDMMVSYHDALGLASGSNSNNNNDLISINLVSNERLYAVWFDSRTNSLRGTTVADLNPTSPAPAICLEPNPFDGFSPAKVLIEDNADGTDSIPKKPQMVFVSADVGYLFYIEPSTKDLRYKKTFDGGQSWQDGATRLAAGDGATKALSVYHDKWTAGVNSNYIHIAYGRNDNKTNYIEFSPGGSGEDQWLAARTIYTGVAYNSDSTISIVRTSDSKLFVTMSNTGSKLLSCDSDCAQSGTWSQLANYPYEGTRDDNELRLMPLSNNKLLILHWDVIAHEIRYSIHSPGTTSFTNTVLGAATDYVGYWPAAWGTTYNKSTNETYLCYNDRVYSVGSSSISNIRTAVFTDAGLQRTDIAISGERNFQCDLAYDELSGDTYLLRSTEYSNSWDNEKVFVMKSSDGMQTWSSSEQVNQEPAEDVDGGSNYRQIGMNVSSPDRIYAWFWELPAGSTSSASSSKYYGATITNNRGVDRLNPRQSQADWFHFLGF